MSDATRSELEGLIALAPWIAFVGLVLWGHIASHRREKQEAAAGNAPASAAGLDRSAARPRQPV